MKAPQVAGAAQGAQYFERYAEPEAKLAEAIADSYLAALVVPLCAEAPSALDGFQSALARAPGRVLLILVVNANLASNARLHADNQQLLSFLSSHYPDARPVSQVGVVTRGALAHTPTHDVLWLDRASDGARLPEREGVGMARKIGGDLAAMLWARGRISCPRIACSDADVTLPDDYFLTLTREVPEAQRSAAWLWNFSHYPDGDRAIDEATVLYEISLRYYTLGLASAGSPYAYQSVGSTLCVDVPAYLSVRGFPKREAAEDFYLLDKLAKVGPLRRVEASPLRIRARASDRVPFGTGRRCSEIAAELASGQAFSLYAPGLFQALGAVSSGLHAFAASGRVADLRVEAMARVPDLALDVEQVLSTLGVFSALENAATQAPAGPVLLRRANTWFDALRTLRFVHELRDRCLPNLRWREALRTAPFVTMKPDSAPEAICRALALSEAQLPAQVGPTLRE